MPEFASNTFPLGQPITDTVTWSVNGTPFDPTGAIKVQWDGPGLVSAVFAYQDGQNVVLKQSIGVYYASITPNAAGTWRVKWTAFDSSVRQIAESVSEYEVVDAAVGATYPVSYPFPWGYCTIADVKARVLPGTWDPDNDVAAQPTRMQTNQLILEASAQVDMTLARTGYTIPLTPIVGQTIQPQAYTLLRNITAHLAAGLVEAARHGSYDKNADPNAAFHIKLADDLLARIEHGSDNLGLFGVGGTFEPDADPTKSLQWISTDSATGQPKTPYFTRDSLSIFFDG